MEYPDGAPNEEGGHLLTDIVTFGSACTIHVDARNKSLENCGRAAIIIGKSDEMKCLKVYLPREKIVIVTQYARNVENLTDGADCEIMSRAFNERL